jgi:hypothetical protein
MFTAGQFSYLWLLTKKPLYMKRVFTLFGLLSVMLCCQQAFAQVGKGQVMLGGSIGVTSTKNESSATAGGLPYHAEGKNTNFAISPRLGVGVGSNWIVGLAPAFGTAKSKSTANGISQGEGTSNFAEIGVFVRKFYPIGERFGVFGQAEAEYGFNKNKSTSSTGVEDEYKSEGYGVFIKPGAYVKAGKRFIVEATIGIIGYSHSNNKPDPGETKSDNSNFVFSLTNSLALGFHVIL